MPLPQLIRDLERRDAKLLRQQPVPVIGVLDLADDGQPPGLALRVFPALDRRRRISFLASIGRQLVDGVVRLGELAPAQHRGEVVLG